jgi:quercetin dioxygenase-like cupin family protein
VEYSKNYKANHWCKKGHIVYCLKGEVINELENGDKSILLEGMTYIVSDGLSHVFCFLNTFPVYCLKRNI